MHPKSASSSEDDRPTVGGPRIFRWSVLEFSVICILIVLPLLAVGCLAISPGWPQVLPLGDEATLELSTWHTLEGLQLEGHGSRFRFQHPGPMYFYLMAPVYWAAGRQYVGITLAVILINLVAIAGTLLVARWRAGRAAFFCWAALLSLYVAFLNALTLSTPWTANVTIVPFLLSVSLFAAVATGRMGYLPAAVLAGSFVVQTHLGYAPALVVAGVLSLLLCTVPRLRKRLGIRGEVSGNVRPVVLITLAVAAVAWAPPIIREIVGQESNVARIVRFFAEHGACHGWWESLRYWSAAMAAFPLSCVGISEQEIWSGTRPVACGITAAVQVVLLPISYWLARRNGRDFEAALCLICVVLFGVSAFSITRIVGPIHPYLIRWMTSLSLLGLVAFGGAVLPCLGRMIWRRFAVGAALAVIICACTFSVKHTFAILPDIQFDSCGETDIRRLVDPSLEFVREKRPQRYLLRFEEPDWPVAAGIVLQLTKAGYRPDVDTEWLFMFASQHAPADRIDGILLLCDPKSARKLRKRTDCRLVAETAEGILFWCPADSGNP